MTGKKFELVRNEVYAKDGHALFRIRALKTFKNIYDDIIEAGEIGGYVEKEDNLSQEGSCWIYDDAMVYHDAFVQDDALICQNAQVFGFANIRDKTFVMNNAKIYDHASCWGEAAINDNAIIEGAAHISDGIIQGNAKICDDAVIRKGICQNNVIVSGKAVLSGYFILDGNMKINHTSDLISVGQIGTDERIYFINQPDNIYVHCVSFHGTIDNFRTTKFNNKYSEFEIGQYELTINYAIKYFEMVNIYKKKMMEKI